MGWGENQIKGRRIVFQVDIQGRVLVQDKLGHLSDAEALTLASALLDTGARLHKKIIDATAEVIIARANSSPEEREGQDQKQNWRGGIDG